MLREIRATLLRWIVGIAFFGLSGWAMMTGYENVRVSLMLSAIPLFVFGVIAIWKPLFALATRPLFLFVDSLFFPGGKLAKPTLNLKLPAFYINEGRYAEALDEYRKILKHYPDETEAYEKAIWLHLEIFEEPDEARKLLSRARRRNLVLDDRIRRMVTAK